VNRFERNQVRDAILHTWSNGQAVVLFTLLKKEGSFFRDTGFCNVLNADGSFVLFNAGPCLDSQLREVGSDVQRTGKSQLRQWDTAAPQDELFGSSLGCGGKLTWLIQRIDSSRAAQLDLLVGASTQTRHEMVEWIFSQREAELLATPRSVSSADTKATVANPNEMPSLRIIRRTDPTVMIYGQGDDARCVVECLARSGWAVKWVDRRPVQNAQPQLRVECKQLSPQDFAAAVNANAPTTVLLMSHDVWTDRQILCDLTPSVASEICMIGTTKRSVLVLSALPESLAAHWQNKLVCPVGVRSRTDAPFAVAMQIASVLDARRHAHDTIQIHDDLPVSVYRPSTHSCEVML
jgi:xanthine dehydrogenase accessory factor